MAQHRNRITVSPSKHVWRRTSVLMESLCKRVLMAAVVTVDPSDGLRLATARSLGEWNTAGVNDGWTLSGASSSSVAGGVLNVTTGTNSTPANVSLTGIANGPSMDYGYFDFVQVRLKVANDYVGDVTFSFGSTGVTGFAANRQFVIPADQLVKDGQYHVYRMDVGLTPWWKETLTDLRVSLAGGTTAKTSSIDYVEVGDKPNDTFVVNANNLNMAPGVTATTRQKIESKHFVFWYDPAVNPGGQTNWTVLAKNALHMAETSQRVFVDKLGFRDVNHWAGDRTTPTKMNIVSWYEGFWSGGDHMNMQTNGLLDQGPGNAMPHEIGHLFDTQNGAWLAGGHWESHANWFREQWVNHYAEYFPTGARSAISPNALFYSNLRLDNSRLIYHDYRLLTPLQFYAGSLGIDADTAAKLWYQGSRDQTAFDKLASVLPAGTSVKDVVGGLMKYWPTLDFPSGQYIKDFQWPNAAAKAEWEYLTTTLLEPVADKAATWRVPSARAPEKYAYSTHVLTPTSGSTSVSATLTGLPSNDPTADWRFTLQAVGANGVTRYSATFANGQTGTLALLPGDTKVMLQVVATPGNTTLNLDAKHNTKRENQDALRLTYPYEVMMTGATPVTGAAARINYTRGNGAFRTNPDGSAGGWVDSTATVASTAYVAAGAQVLGTSRVLNNAKILDFATVAGNATVSGNAIISGYAVVRDNANVSANARVRDHASITASGVVNGNAVVEQYAMLNGDFGVSTATGDAIVRGVSLVQGGTVGGTAITDSDYTFGFNLTDGTHANNFPYDAGFYDYYDASQKKPRGLIASYRVNETTGSQLFDEFGALNAQLRGTPNRPNETALNTNAIGFNGTDQYALLDRSLAEVNDGTYGMWVNPATAAADQALIYFGSGSNSLRLTARDANGFARLTITVGGVTQQLVSTIAVPTGAWTHLAVTFSGGTATFYVNGAAAGSAAMSLRPNDVLVSESLQSAEHIYLGRDSAGGLFSGKLDDVRFYNVALTPAEVANEVRRAGATLGVMYADKAVTFTNTVAESGVHDGLVRTFSAWIKPNASPAVASDRYQAILDSTDERNNGYGQGVGLNNGKFVVRLGGTDAFNGQMWNTGVNVTVGQWQKITVTLTGSVARLYVNDVLAASKSYTASANAVAGKNYRVGYSQTSGDTATRIFYDGQIYDLRISDRAIAPGSVASAVAHYKTDETGGATLADASGNGRTATLSGLYSFSAGKTGNALTLNGGYATLPAGVVSGLTDFTVAAWVNPTSRPNWSRIFDFGTGTNANMFLTANPGGTNFLRFAITTSGGGNEQQINTTTTLPVNAWSHVAITLVGNVATLYVNGTVVGTNNNMTLRPSDLGSTTQNWLGRSQYGDLAYLGKIDDFRILNTGLSASAVAALAGSTAAPTITTPASATLNANGTSAALSVLGNSASGEANLTYTWSTVGTLPSPVTFSANGSNAAKSTTVNFISAGTYQFRVTITDTAGQTTTSDVTITVPATPGSVVTASSTVIAAVQQQFTVYDVFGQPMSAGTVTWSASAGTITPAGLYTPPATGASTATITATSGAKSASTTVAIAAPRGWYKADAANGTTLTDASGNARNGTLTGTYSYAAGKISNALTLNGGNATLPTGIISGLNEVTIAAWVRPTSNPTWSRIFDFGTGTNNYMFLSANPGGANTLRLAITTSGGGGEQQINSNVALPTNAWSHFAVTIAANGDGTYTGTLYLNGSAIGTNAAMTLTAASLGNTNLNYIGKSQYPDPTYLGAIDDFRVYGAAASASAIASLYAGGNAYTTSAPTNVSAVAATATKVNVSWTDNSSAEVGYLIERATNAAFTAGLISFNAPSGTTTYADTSVVGNTTYYYRVSAVLPGGTTAGPATAPSVKTPAAASGPTLNSFAVNDGSAQRSTVTSLTVVFSQPVTLEPGAIVLSGVKGNTSNIQFTQASGDNGKTYTLTFPTLMGRSLGDGSFELKVNAALVTDSASGLALPSDQTFQFYRLFGDGDGNGTTEFNDFLGLQNAFNATPADANYNAAFDYDGNDSVNFDDFLAFQNRFGMTAGS